MGVSTLTAARILKGQGQKLVGPERALLSFEVRSQDNNSIPFEISRRSPTCASCARTAWTARWPTPRARRPPTLAASRTTSAPSGCLGGSSTSSARVRHFQRIRQSLQLADTLQRLTNKSSPGAFNIDAGPSEWLCDWYRYFRSDHWGQSCSSIQVRKRNLLKYIINRF